MRGGKWTRTLEWRLGAKKEKEDHQPAGGMI